MSNFRLTKGSRKCAVGMVLQRRNGVVKAGRLAARRKTRRKPTMGESPLSEEVLKYYLSVHIYKPFDIN